ncbi:MAG TPA: periplasmic heavy metal sensor [Candidatus Binatia bacterium]|nr:periplasmic heavy metal sensor [Candidatus Binatia bacterium]
MKNKRLLTFVLVVSLALNLAFLAAMAYKRTGHGKNAPRPPLDMKNDFQLAAGQEKQVRAIVRKFKIDSLLAKEDIRDKRVEIIEELGSPDCDPATVRSLTDGLNLLENQLNKDFIAALLKINDILEPGQRLNLLYRLSRNWFFLTPTREKGGDNE